MGVRHRENPPPLPLHIAATAGKNNYPHPPHLDRVVQCTGPYRPEGREGYAEEFSWKNKIDMVLKANTLNF